ncbi:MAG: hypothetical protein ACFB50_07880 [Rubrobacteraceae bacterium]
MTTVFISGSRKLGRLNEEIRQRVQNIADQSFKIVLGDANGADKALQNYLRILNYPYVTVYCAGDRCRNNLGSWPTRSVNVPPNLKGRDFYTQKDKVMADEADYGLVFWDGKSPGALENVVELLKRNKKTLVYLSPKKSFYSIAAVSDLRSLLANCGQAELENINKKIGLERALQELEGHTQAELSF